ncbi:MAG: putative molybdenum carrier protein [Ilumatobacteraceae bacterium]
MISRILAGGQTGADRGGLDGAMRFWGDDTDRVGGWCPAGRRAEDGPIPNKYPLQETEDWAYPQRTKFNVKDSDGTVVFTHGDPTGGSKLTLELASANRAFIHIDLAYMLKEDAVEMIADWADATGITVLNVAGSRESSCPGIQEWVADVIEGVLQEVGEK